MLCSGTSPGISIPLPQDINHHTLEAYSTLCHAQKAIDSLQCFSAESDHAEGAHTPTTLSIIPMPRTNAKNHLLTRSSPVRPCMFSKNSHTQDNETGTSNVPYILRGKKGTKGRKLPTRRQLVIARDSYAAQSGGTLLESLTIPPSACFLEINKQEGKCGSYDYNWSSHEFLVLLQIIVKYIISTWKRTTLPLTRC